MLKAIFLMLQLRISCRMCSLCVVSTIPLYHLKNVALLSDVFSESGLDCHGSNIFALHPLLGIVGCLPIGGFHLISANATSRYPWVNVPPFSCASSQATSSSSHRKLHQLNTTPFAQNSATDNAYRVHSPLY
jgi:hypothetical protein